MRQRKAKDLEARLAKCSGHMVYQDDGSLRDYCSAQTPLCVEIGCGKGQFIIKKAAADPECRFLAIEGQETVILRAAEKAMCVSSETDWPENVPGEERMEGVSAKLDNLKFLSSFVEHMGDFFEENQLAGIYLNFSDPWPKARHAKRRLTYRERLKDYAWALKPGGFIEIKTDNDDLFAFTLEEIEAESDLLHITEMTRDLHDPLCLYAAKEITTEYEDPNCWEEFWRDRELYYDDVIEANYNASTLWYGEFSDEEEDDEVNYSFAYKKTGASNSKADSAANRDITTLTIPDEVTAIEDREYVNFENLENVIIPEGVTSIGKQAFANCTSLSSISIPDSIVRIGEGVFDYDYDGPIDMHINSLESFLNIESGDRLDRYKGEGINLYIKEELTEHIVIPKRTTEIKDYIFSECRMKSITIPEGVVCIGEAAFLSCFGLTNVTIPSSITTIGGRAFSDCVGLESITIPESVISIGNGAFESCGMYADSSFTIHAPSGSYAEEYARKNDIPFEALD